VNKFSVGQRVWAIGYVSGIWYPAVVIGLPRPTNLMIHGRITKPNVLAYRIETADSRRVTLACEEINLRPRDDRDCVSVSQEIEMEAEA
jgi:hypothetical protein